MTDRVRRMGGVLAGVLALLLMAACGGSGGGDGDGGKVTIDSKGVLSKMTTVKVAVSSRALVVMAPWIADSWGDFKKRNIKVEPVAMDATSSLQMMATGKIDARISGPTAGLLNSISDGIDVREVAPGPIPSAETGSGIWVSTAALKGQTFAPSMLKGKKVGSSQGNTGMSAVMLARLLDQGGLKPGDVTIETMSTANMPAALENGSLFAGIILEPLNVTLQDKKSAVKVAPQLPEGWPNATFEFGPTLLRDNPDVGKAFVAALRDMYRNNLQGDYLNDERIDVISQQLEQPKEALQRSHPDIYQTTLSFPDNFVAELEKTWRLWPGLLKSDKTFKTSDVIDDRFMKYANSLP